MATSLTVPEVQLSAEDRKLWRLWRCLPADRALPEEEIFELFEQEAGRPGDDAWASFMLTQLQLLGAVDGSNQRSAEFPKLLPAHAARPGTELFNQALERQQQGERERRERSDAARQREYETGPEMRERRELIALMREVAQEEVKAELREVKDRLAQLEGNRTTA